MKTESIYGVKMKLALSIKIGILDPKKYAVVTFLGPDKFRSINGKEKS